MCVWSNEFLVWNIDNSHWEEFYVKMKNKIYVRYRKILVTVIYYQEVYSSWLK